MSKPTKTNGTGLLSKLRSVGDTRPEGWKTLEELLAEDPMPETTARNLLNDATLAGTIEVKKLRSPTKLGMRVRLNYKEIVK